MSWPASLTVGVLTAIVACVAAGAVANLCVGWYRISSFEGASGYWVVAMALLGAGAGAVIGIAASRLLPDPTFLKALGSALAIVLLLAGSIAGVARLRADVPPRLDGHQLVLAIELKWPANRNPADVADSTEWYIRLSALSGNVARVSQEGPLWREDARLEDGRWIVPGAVDVFTSRGKRVISFAPDSLVGQGFQVPLPGRPGTRQLEWSDWLPASRSGSENFQFRFKVVPDNQPLRTETVGPWQIVTIGNGFGLYSFNGRGPMQWQSNAHFEIRHGGTVVTVDDPNAAEPTAVMDAVAVVNAAEPALVVQVNAPNGTGRYLLLVADGDSVRSEPIAIGGNGIRAAPITDDSAAYAATLTRQTLTGRVDRTTFATPGAYLFSGAILDTRTLAVHHYDTNGIGDLIERIPPLGMAPDGLSFVRLTFTDSASVVALRVIDLAGGESYLVPVDRARMRWAEYEQIDPAWLAHYFGWQRDASGRDRLVARSGVTPLPHRGILTFDDPSYREYRLSPALEGLRGAVEEFLVNELGGVVESSDPAAFAHEVRVGDVVVHVSWRDEDGHVGLWVDRGGDTALVTTIAAKFDAALATGRYDQYFGP